MPIKGYKVEMLTLLRKLKARMESKGQVNAKRRKVYTSKFRRQLWKLECSVNYNGAKGRGSNNCSA